MIYKILAVNPGSTSTKIAVFENDRMIYGKSIAHEVNKLKEFQEIQDQMEYRKVMVEQELQEQRISLADIDVFVGRGGGLMPVKGGTYPINEKLLEHARKGIPGQHPAQLASQICHLLAREYGGKAFVVNPPDVDEFDEIARVTGLADLYRESRIHALNQKEIAIRYCAAHGKKYEESDLIICHIGGGISVTAHHKGRMIDSNDIIGGDGPMTPTRAGSLPAVKVMRMAYSGKYTQKELYTRLSKEGGLIDHLGTADVKEIEQRIAHGDEYARLVFDAMIYQIAKNIGACACVLKGKMDAIILTGGIANSKYLVKMLGEYTQWIASVEVMAGEFEMEALAAGVLRVINGAERPVEYTGEPVWKGFQYREAAVEK
jgi:butyrate kinase